MPEPLPPLESACQGRRRLLRAAPALLAGACSARAASAVLEPALVALTADGQALLTLDLHTAAPRGRLPLPRPCQALARLGPGQLLAADDEGRLMRLVPDAAAAAWRVAATAPVWQPSATAAARLAGSRDGRWVLVADAATTGDPRPHLHLLDARQLQPVKSWSLPGPVAWLADAAHRQAFVLALATLPALWTLSYDERAEDFYEGLVHDYRLGEGVPQRGFLNVRRMPLPQPLLAGCLDAEDTEIAGRGWVFNLDARRAVARVPTLQPPQAGCAALLPVLSPGAPPCMALPVPGQPALALWHTGRWAPAGQAPLPASARQVVALPGAAGLLALGDDGRLMHVALPGPASGPGAAITSPAAARAAGALPPLRQVLRV